MGSLDVWKDALNSVGWFIPPYVQMGVVSKIVAKIKSKGTSFSQSDLERSLGEIYNAAQMSAMVTERYPIVPFIKDYVVTISESVEAHFLGLDHVAVGGLIPVIEGAGRQLAAQRNITIGGIKDIFRALATDCKSESAQKNIGAVDEIESMMDSFIEFTEQYFYKSSQNYPLLDRTNRHGILYGAYTDTDYSTPLNYYKTIAAVDFLSFISSFRAHISWFGPDPTLRAYELFQYYESLAAMRARRNSKKP